MRSKSQGQLPQEPAFIFILLGEISYGTFFKTYFNDDIVIQKVAKQGPIEFLKEKSEGNTKKTATVNIIIHYPLKGND